MCHENKYEIVWRLPEKEFTSVSEYISITVTQEKQKRSSIRLIAKANPWKKNAITRYVLK